MLPPLFSPGPATDPAYLNLRAGGQDHLVAARSFIESMWAQFHGFADANFLTEVRRDFHARFWEMYLTCTMLQSANRLGYRVSCPKPGPDILLEFESGRVWVEAVTATNGAPGLPDTLVQPNPDGSTTIPEEKIVLRYTNAIQEKYRKYLRYLRYGRVRKGDAYIVAINAALLSYRGIHAEDDAPPFLKALYPLGRFQVLISRDSGEIVGHQNEARFEITKASGKKVGVQTFLGRPCRGISAVLCSFANAVYDGASLGSDFELAYNPMGRSPLHPRIIPASRTWTTELTETGDQLVGKALIY